MQWNLTFNLTMGALTSPPWLVQLSSNPIVLSSSSLPEVFFSSCSTSFRRQAKHVSLSVGGEGDIRCGLRRRRLFDDSLLRFLFLEVLPPCAPREDDEGISNEQAAHKK